MKCDEEKIPQAGKQEPQCRGCFAARLNCDWQTGPVIRKASAITSVMRATRKVAPASRSSSSMLPRLFPLHSQTTVQAANSLILFGADRACLAYIKDSVLVVALGKRWPWSAISYSYHKVATNESMVMSMILATAASEMHRCRLRMRLRSVQKKLTCRGLMGKCITEELCRVSGTPCMKAWIRPRSWKQFSLLCGSWPTTRTDLEVEERQ